MRRRGYLVMLLVLANAFVFAVQSAVPPLKQIQLVNIFGLSLGGLESGHWWEFLTYAFLHGNFLHLLLNMASLWFAGRIVEDDIGSGHFLALYCLGAIGGGIGQMLLGLPEARLIGASGSVFAVLLAFTTMYRDQEITALLFFILPLRMKAKFIGWALVGFTVAAIVLNFEPWIGHAAHLGGAVTGYLFARVLGYGKVSLPERLLARLFRPRAF